MSVSTRTLGPDPTTLGSVGSNPFVDLVMFCQGEKLVTE